MQQSSIQHFLHCVHVHSLFISFYYYKHSLLIDTLLTKSHFCCCLLHIATLGKISFLLLPLAYLLPLTNCNFYFCSYLACRIIILQHFLHVYCRHSSKTGLCVLCSLLPLFPLLSTAHLTDLAVHIPWVKKTPWLTCIAILIDLLSLHARDLKTQIIFLFRYLPFATRFWTFFPLRICLTCYITLCNETGSLWIQIIWVINANLISSSFKLISSFVSRKWHWQLTNC